MQRLLIFQQNDSGERKVAGIRRYGGDRFDIKIETIDDDLPPVLDDTAGLFPAQLEADLVLDFLRHPDLSHDLALHCVRRQLPLIASGKRLTIEGVLTPPVWCALAGQVCLGEYGRRFGRPQLIAAIDGHKIARVDVVRGAPCGATWQAARRLEGVHIDEAAVRMGLETQYFCVADPAGWDPLWGKSPVHLAGDLHRTALVKALRLIG